MIKDKETAITFLYGMRAENFNLDDSYTRDRFDALTWAIRSLEQGTVTDFADKCRECGAGLKDKFKLGYEQLYQEKMLELNKRKKELENQLNISVQNNIEDEMGMCCCTMQEESEDTDGISY